MNSSDSKAREAFEAPAKTVQRWMSMIDYAYQCRDDIRSSSGETPRSGELRLLAEEMRAALQWAASQQAAEGWRPIETAPKDGTLVLLCCVGWPHSLMRGEPWPIKVGGMWKGRWDIFGASWEPTHWMPLPSPPATQGGAE